MKAFRIEIKWALILTFIAILWMLLEKMLGWHDALIGKQLRYTLLFQLLVLIIYVAALADKKKNYYNNNMNWTQGFLSGAILTVAAAILSPIVQAVTFKYISPNYFHNMIQYNVSHRLQTREQAEAIFNLKTFVLQGCQGGLSFGVITSAIAALFVKNKQQINNNQK
jgi:membrane protease YdiL (CAAX protease family)